MRILVLSSDYPPRPGGIARLSWETARGLARHAQVEVLAALEPPGLRELTLPFKLTSMVRKFKPDAIWSALWFPDAAFASYLVSGKIVQSFSAYASEFIPSQATFNKRCKARLGFLLRRLFRTADRIFPLSRYTEQRLKALGAYRNMEVLNGGVNDSWFELYSERPARGRTLLTVARLDPNKGHDMVIEALPRIPVPDVRYLIIGPLTPHLSVLRARARELGVGHQVEYRGIVSDQELAQAYAEADLFVMASREIEGWVEGFGLTFLEAAATGLPSVAGNSGGIPDAVEHGVSGLLVDPTDPDEIADAITRLLTDHAYRLQLGRQARERAERFRWNVITDQLYASLEKAVQERC